MIANITRTNNRRKPAYYSPEFKQRLAADASQRGFRSQLLLKKKASAYLLYPMAKAIPAARACHLVPDSR